MKSAYYFRSALPELYVAFLNSNGPVREGIGQICKNWWSELEKKWSKLSKLVKIVREKVPKLQNYLSSSTVFPPLLVLRIYVIVPFKVSDKVHHCKIQNPSVHQSSANYTV